MNIKLLIFILLIFSIFLIKISINNEKEIIIYKYINDYSKNNYISLKNKFQDMFEKKSPWVNSFKSSNSLKNDYLNNEKENKEII